MSKELFSIEPKQAFDFNGKVIGTITKVMIRDLGYKLFSPIVPFYIAYYNEKGEVLREQNIDIPTPSDWGSDDMVPINAVASVLGVTIIP
jgi:hypothetical protein